MSGSVTKRYRLGLVLGRFQGFHMGHEAVIERARSLCDEVLVFVGSADKSGTEHNPFPYEFRAAMLKNKYGGSNVTVAPLNDLGVGNVPAWGDYVLESARAVTGRLPDCVVYGDEDKCTKWFPNYPELHFETLDREVVPMSGTRLREIIREGDFGTFRAVTSVSVHGFFPELRQRLLQIDRTAPEDIPDCG